MKAEVFVDPKNESIVKIPEKCVKCGLCVHICQENNGSRCDCVNCGQCILACPTGALIGKNRNQELWNYIKNPDYTVVVSTSPSVRVGIGEEFGMEAGSFVEGKLVTALKMLGFDFVFDTTFGADLTAIEEASELLMRMQTKQHLPMFTSCCPSWVLYMEKYHASDLHLLSSCKSPIGMQSVMVKNYFASLKGFDPKRVIHVALTPCVSKKSEMKRPEISGTDFVITTTELASMILSENIDFCSLSDSSYDSLLSKGSGGGVGFGASGGVAESTLRTAYYLLHKMDAPNDFYQLTEIQGSSSRKEAVVDFGTFRLNVLVIQQLSNVEEMYAQFSHYDFIEVMTCPGGCIGGAGLPKWNRVKLADVREKRMQSLQQNDASLRVRCAYQNPDIQKIYSEFLEYPLSDKCKEYLHTSYGAKEQKEMLHS